ncbi:60S acidic ribosomal protein P1-alpha 3 [Podila humilis]|nr:60S acidic ribosomal protein P1-alpha 3 [Podila humilis]
MSFPATPRINSAMLGNYIGQTVRLVGSVTATNGNQATLTTSDKGQVTVISNEASAYHTTILEVIGEVNTDLSISELTFCPFGDDFDMDVYNELVKKMQQFPTVF